MARLSRDIDARLISKLVGIVAVSLGAFIFLIIVARNVFDPTYARPKEIIDLGEVRYLLEPKTHLRDKAILVHFDEKEGWSAVSTRSTISGCDLSFQDTMLYDPCTRSFWLHDGRPAGGQAKVGLPYFRIYYETYSDGRVTEAKKHHLFANTGIIVPQKARFKQDNLIAAASKIKELNKIQGIGIAMQVPKILQGQGDGEQGPMFNEDEYIVDYN